MNTNNNMNLVKWATTIIILATIAYNSLDTRSILQNDVKHIKDEITEIKTDIRELRYFLVDKELQK